MTSTVHRRLCLAAGLFTAAALALTACGPGAAQEKAPAAETRTVTDASGERIRVPAAPKRVVALTETDADAAIALGVTPVGMVNGRFAKEIPAYLKEKMPDAKVVGDIQAPKLDAVAKARPDVILAGFLKDENVLAQLKKITPATVLTQKVTDDWKTTLRSVADVLNRGDKVDEVLDAYDERVAEVKAELGGNAGSEVSITRWNPTGPSYMLSGSFASLVVKDLGLTRPKAQLSPEGVSPSDPLSLENLKMLDGDWMFLGTLNPDAEAALAEAKKVDAFKNLGVVKAGKVVNVDGAIWTSRGGPAAAEMIISDVEKALAK